LKKNPDRIYLISDSTGELGERFINALMTQFPQDRIQFQKFVFVTGAFDVRKILEKITAEGSVLFHTVIDRKLKKMIHDLSYQKGIASFDLTGPPTNFVDQKSGCQAQMERCGDPLD
jgi:regulator of PEP synthase PpsR (kinase-PPPase family)